MVSETIEDDMIDRNASYDLLQTTIKMSQKRIDVWSQQVEELQEQIAKLNHWIHFEQADIDDANEMLINMQELEGCDESD
jgi:cell division FtsZ-interacting protein ZapD